MLIVDSQIHLWQNGKMSAHHRQIPTYSVDDALAEMASAGVDCAVIHPPSSLGEAVNALAVEAVRAASRQVLHPRALRSPEPGSRADRRALARAAGHARVPVHLQPAAAEGVVDRRLARLVLGGLRDEQACPSGCWPAGSMAALAKIAERHPRLKLHIDHLGRGGGGSGITDDAAFADLADTLALARVSQRRDQDVRRAELLEPALSVQEHPRLPAADLRGVRARTAAFWGTDITRMPCSYRQCVTMFTEELPWLKGRDLERVMGGAVVDWLGWKRPGGQA